MSALPTLGVLEARGMAALLAATDRMLKAAAVTITGYHRVGSGWVTVTVEGDTGAVQTALREGQEEVERVGELIAAEVVVRPEPDAVSPMPHPRGLRANDVDRRAIGVLETVGITPLLLGTDAVVKAANVDIHGWSPIGGALCHVVFHGDQHSVTAALESAADVAARHGTVHGTLLLPAPSEGIEVLLPARFTPSDSSLDALGILECTGYLGALAGSDAMVKEADVDLLRLTLGSGGRVGVFIRGRLEEVNQALEAGAREAAQAGDYNTHASVPRPDASAVACFGGPDPAASSGDPLGESIGILETRSTVALVTAVDQMMKTANVVFDGRYKVGAYNTSAVIRGELSAVRAALDVGRAAAASLGDSTHAHLIPSPAPSLEPHLVHRTGG